MRRYRNETVIMKLDRQKKVILPNGITFYVKYKRVRISSLPNNVKIRKAYWRSGRRIRRQQGDGTKIGHLLEKNIQKALPKIGVKNAPTLCKKGVWKIKNEKARRVLNSY